MDDYKNRTDEFKDADLKINFRSAFDQMSTDHTKLYAFFCDATWETKDPTYLILDREKGLK